MLFQYTHYPTVTIVTEHKTQFLTHFSKTNSKQNYWLFQRDTYDTSFGYFMSGKKNGIKQEHKSQFLNPKNGIKVYGIYMIQSIVFLNE